MTFPIMSLTHPHKNDRISSNSYHYHSKPLETSLNDMETRNKIDEGDDDHS